MPWWRRTGQRVHSLRELFNGLRYVVRYGIAWRAMPNDLPPWHAVYDQASRWLRHGCFEMLAADLRAVLRVAAGRAEEPSAAVLDSRTLRSTPESGHRAGWDGHKRTRGSKLHLAVDTLGHFGRNAVSPTLALHVTSAASGPSKCRTIRQLPDTDTAQKPTSSPFSGCGRQPGRAMWSASDAWSSRARMREISSTWSARSLLRSSSSNSRLRPL